MNIKKITTLLDTLHLDIQFGGETQENKIVSFDTIDKIRKELNN
tara:strand:- start:506 stop:637 length:132 start_codon:yes stop_codon:yes gene_type:complete